MVKAKKSDNACCWRGCGAKPTRILTWDGGVQWEVCDAHADVALAWAATRQADWANSEREADNGKK